MESYSNVLVTGGSGLLGSKLKELLPHAWFPKHNMLDIEKEWIPNWFVETGGKNIDIIVHLAAYTSPPKIDEDPDQAILTNIIGTSNIVRTCIKHNIYLIYMSTDYVFDGEKSPSLSAHYHLDEGLYKEEHPTNPVNKYAWSKLGGECAVRMYDNSLIVRTSFGPDIFPYDKAFVDQYTSREPVSTTAQKIKDIVDHTPHITGILHIGGKRQTVFEYAKQTKPDVQELKRNEVNFKVPMDTSLDTTKYDMIFGGKDE